MQAANTLGELLTTLLDRRPFSRKLNDSRPITELCQALLSERIETSGLQLATAALEQFKQMAPDEKAAFFTYLNDDLDIDAEQVAEMAKAYGLERSAANFEALAAASEPKRQDLFRKLNQAPGATADLVAMRRDLLVQLKTMPDLSRTNFDLSHLLKSWFNRGFLVLRQITWDSPAAILEKIIAYEAVHEIHTWDDLRRRLQPADRRCFAFFHPAMPDDPLIFVEVALTKGVPGSIQKVLSDNRQPLSESGADTAVFYSISNCQAGLAGISFGDLLIKQVVRDISRDLQNIKTFVTLSPIPGFGRWLEEQSLSEIATLDDNITKLAAYYLVNAKNQNGKPLDPVAKFHLGNGAMVHLIHPRADLSQNGMSQSGGVMVNYLYNLARIPQNIKNYVSDGEITMSSAVKSLSKQGAKELGPEKTETTFK
ncbi:MAG: malonyl-CoA decarboxylase family protein [Rhizobiaceae bacterium]|nr:malonyl-CoA decarboxylase family protein [Rhizobiaceae bacterium]